MAVIIDAPGLYDTDDGTVVRVDIDQDGDRMVRWTDPRGVHWNVAYNADGSYAEEGCPGRIVSKHVEARVVECDLWEFDGKISAYAAGQRVTFLGAEPSSGPHRLRITNGKPEIVESK